VLRDDPTVRLLEEETASVLGKEAALFVPSGCMGNEIAAGIQTRRGDTILLHRDSHFVYTESAAIQGLLGLSFRMLDGERGRLRAEDVAAELTERADGVRLLSLEQTNNWSSATPLLRSLSLLMMLSRFASEPSAPFSAPRTSTAALGVQVMPTRTRERSPG